MARVEAETHDVRRDFVREERTREYFFEHGHEARGVRLFIRSPGAGRRDFCDVLARRSRVLEPVITFVYPLSMLRSNLMTIARQEEGQDMLEEDELPFLTA